MARKPNASIGSWPSLTLEGNLIAPAMVSSIDRRDATDQAEADYGVRKGLTIREEISAAFRVGQAHFDDFSKVDDPSPATTTRFVRDFLTQTFGFADISPATAPVALTAGDGRVPIVVVSPADQIDRRSTYLSTERSRSAAFALQDHLNDRDDAQWGLATNGTHIRLMRDNASLTRPAYIEANLAQIFATDDIASFAALWLLIHRSRFGNAPSPATDCPLERWRDTGAREGETARNRLAAQVEEALKILGSGFLEANPDLRTRLTSGQLPITDWFNVLLRLVYRLIFLMVAEDRNLLQTPNANADSRKLYAEGYSLTHLRAQSIRRSAWDRHHDRYEGMKIVFRALMRGEPRLGLPALGGLFTATQLPDLETAKLPNRAFLNALFRLSWQTDGNAMVPVNWRAMETLELGSVYESLLELQPQIANGNQLVFATDAAEMKGNQRKTTSSYYTPDSLVQALLDTALDPVLDQIDRSSANPAEDLLNLTVIDPACGSGHFLLAAARRIATRVARHRAGGTPSATDFRHALRDTARRCLYGVDRNPMAVELTKVALWIETVDPGLPLGFFDSQIRCGDALIGVFDLKALDEGIPNAAYKPRSGDDKDTAKYYFQANRDARDGQGDFPFDTGKHSLPELRSLAADYTGFRSLLEDTLDQIETKRSRYDKYRNSQRFHCDEMACDMYVAAFLLPKVGGAPASRGARQVPTSEDVWNAKRNGQVWGPLIGRATIARTARAFHWPLEFPDVMASGGFDVVLGNPPWDTMSPDYKEYFAVHDPNIRHMSPDEQEEVYARLLADPVISKRWEQHCADLYAAVHFIKSSGRYRLFAEGNLGKGDFNVYRMFVETALAATKKGRVAAQFVPEGLYNGANATAIRKELFSAFRLDRLAGFENTKGIWFPKIDTRMKFCIYVAWKGGKTEEFSASFRVNSSQKLQEFKSAKGLKIPVSVVKEFSPDALAVMEFAAQSEIDICARMYALYPKFGAEIDGVPYRHYMAEVHMGNNRGLFSEGDEGLPVFEGRMIDGYDYRAKGYVSGRGRSAVWDDLPFGQPSKRITPQWRILTDSIPDKLGDRIYRYRIGFGDVASPTNQRGLIASLLPGGTVCGHTVPTIEFLKARPNYLLLWLGVANSFAMDFLVRMKVSLHMSYTIMDSLPFPRDFAQTPSSTKIAERVCSLCAVGPEMEEFLQEAVALGILASANDVIEDPDQRAVVAAEIDALVARDVFKMKKEEMLYILDPDNILGKDCGVETFKALRNAEMRAFREYRTQRLIEEAWDRLQAEVTVAAPGVALDQNETPAPINIVSRKPTPQSQPNAAWERTASHRGDTGAALAAILKSIDGERPIRTIRLAAALMLEPRLLMPLLGKDESAEWHRLVGSEADPLSSNVTPFATRVNSTWGDAVRQHRGNGRLVENIQRDTWTPGPGLDVIETSGWPDGRAAFVLDALQTLDLDTTVTRLPDEVRDWIANAAAA